MQVQLETISFLTDSRESCQIQKGKNINIFKLWGFEVMNLLKVGRKNLIWLIDLN